MKMRPGVVGGPVILDVVWEDGGWGGGGVAADVVGGDVVVSSMNKKRKLVWFVTKNRKLLY